MRTIPIEEVRPQPDTLSVFCGCECPTFGKYILLSEDKGFIFRPVKDRQYGHSGHSPTIKAACFKALQNTDTKCYEFNSLEELNAWLNAE